MEFTVPQFIDYEAKIFGPFTFKQFIIVAGAGIICFITFYKAPLFIALPVSIVVGGGTVVMTFLKIGGRSPVVVIKNFALFTTSPKVYIWHRKVITPKVIIKKEVEKEEEEEKRVVRRSRLSSLSAQIDTKTKNG